MKSNVLYDICLDWKNNEPSIWISLPGRMRSCRNKRSWFKPINKQFISIGWAVRVGRMRIWLTPERFLGLQVMCNCPVNSARKGTSNLQLKTNLPKLSWNSWLWKSKRWKKKRNCLELNCMSLYISLKSSNNNWN